MRILRYRPWLGFLLPFVVCGCERVAVQPFSAAATAEAYSAAEWEDRLDALAQAATESADRDTEQLALLQEIRDEIAAGKQSAADGVLTAVQEQGGTAELQQDAVPMTRPCPCSSACTCGCQGGGPCGCAGLAAAVESSVAVGSASVPHSLPTPAAATVSNVLSGYSGQRWVYRGNGTLRQHLQATHGYASAELAGLSQWDLERLHGHAHTSGDARAIRQSAPRVVTTRRPMTYRLPARMYSSCPGGRCNL